MYNNLEYFSLVVQLIRRHQVSQTARHLTPLQQRLDNERSSGGGFSFIVCTVCAEWFWYYTVGEEMTFQGAKTESDLSMVFV